MIETMIKSAVALMAAGLIASFLKRQSASVRHVVWTAGLLGAMAIPLCAWLLPEWRMTSGGWTGWAVSMLQAVMAYLGGFRQVALVVWLAGAALGMALLLYGTGKLMWVALGSGPVHDSRWEAVAEEVRKELGIRRPVRLVQNRRVPYLGTWGIVAPRVLLPIDADTWADSRIRMVLGHELAHIKRHDWVVQVLADAARAIYWFNPLFWIASSRLRHESELACDDAVVRMGTGSVQYAEELLHMTRSLRAEHPLQSPILGMAQPSQLEQRLVALLDPRLNRLAATPWAATVVAAVAIGLTLPLAAVRTADTVASAVPAPKASAPAPVMPQPVAGDPAKKLVEPKRSVQPSAPLLAVAEAQTGEAVANQPVAKVQESAEQLTTTLIEAPAATPTLTPTPTPTPPQPAIAATPAPAPPYECKVTPSVRETRATGMKVSLGNGPWLMNEDKTIWAADQPYVAGRAVSTVWMRPANTELKVSGRRLDAQAERVTIQPSGAFPAPYLATVMTFPEAGCWEVTATAGEHQLTFVTLVRE